MQPIIVGIENSKAKRSGNDKKQAQFIEKILVDPKL